MVVDLTLWTENGRVSLLNRRVAPVTINYLGFPGTSGCTGKTQRLPHLPCSALLPSPALFINCNALWTTGLCE